MSFSGRLHNVAFGGFLVALLLAPLASAQENKALQQNQAKQSQTEQKTPTPQLAASPAIDGPQSVETDWNKVECAKPKNHDEADLCEQRRMSKAAENSVSLSLIQIGLGIIGAGLVFWSLYYTRVATKAAIGAVQAATEAARIARNADRPYISLTKPRLFEPSKVNKGSVLEPQIVRRSPIFLHVHFGLRNIGRGLAIILEYGINHEICADGHHGGRELITRDGFGGFTLSPESEWKADAAFHVFEVQDDEFEAIATHRKSIYVYGYIRYSDLFGIVRRTGFAYEAPLYNNRDFGALAIEATNRSLWYDREEAEHDKA